MLSALGKYGHVRYNEPLARHSTWRIGGPADVLVEPSSKECLAELISFLNANKQAWLVIGAGSNLLFDDKGVRAVVIKIGRNFSNVKINGSNAICQSGIWMPWLACKLGAAGLSGLEHAVGIPGNLGGLVVMNGGSQRKAIGKNVEYVEAVTLDGSIKRLSKEQCKFGYRSSVFQAGGFIIAEVGLQLNLNDPRAIRREMLGILKERRRKFPLKQPSCGSVFLSDADNFNATGAPGAILDQMGLKGLRIGGAKVSELHANFIVNTGGAKSSEVLELVALLQEKVCDRFGIRLQCEFRYASEDCRILKV